MGYPIFDTLWCWLHIYSFFFSLLCIQGWELSLPVSYFCVTQVAREEILSNMVSSTCCSCNIGSNGAEDQLCVCCPFVPRKRLKMLVDKTISDLEAVTCIGNISDVEPQRHHVDGCVSHGYSLPFLCRDY